MSNTTIAGANARNSSKFSHNAKLAEAGERMRAKRIVGGDGVAALGNNTRNPASRVSSGLRDIARTVDTVEKYDPETGEIIRLKVGNQGKLTVDKNPQQARAERWALKSVVNRIFPISRTAKCSRLRLPNQSVKVLKDTKHGKAHYSGLMRCGSVWWCPVCAAKIAERRRAELVAATDSARSMGLQVLLMTCTVPHGLGDDVNEVLRKMRKAWRSMLDNRAGKRIRQLLGVRGHIRTLEVTYGQNGFHPHFHVLIFADVTFTVSSFQTGFYPLWLDACRKAGLPPPSEKHGLRVDSGERAASYVSKWGLEDEMTKGHLKTSRGEKGMTPWDMLREVLENGCERSRALFQVYAHAFKGQRQLNWSDGLRDLLGLACEASDEELAAQIEENSIELAELTPEQWRAVLFTRSEAALLDLAEREPDQIEPFLAAIVATASHTVRPSGRFASDSQQNDLRGSIANQLPPHPTNPKGTNRQSQAGIY